MSKPGGWWKDKVPELTRLLDEGHSYSRIAKALGTTRGSVASAIRRHVHGFDDYGIYHGRASERDKWTEDKLTEKWADRKGKK